MRTNIIALIRNRLIGIDELLPVLMEVRSLDAHARIHFVFLDHDQAQMIQQNYHLWEAVQSLDGRIVVLKTPHRWLTLLRLVKFVVSLAGQRNIILKTADTLPRHKAIVKILKRISRTTEIKAFLSQFSLQGHKNLYQQMLLSIERVGPGARFDPLTGEYDHFLSVLSCQQWKEIYQLDADPDKLIKMGYRRKLPQWDKFIRQAAARWTREQKDPYFLFVLTTLGHRMDNFDEPLFADLLRESLTILKPYNSVIRTVFKPHVITDMAAFEKILRDVGYSNYVIDYGHPMALSIDARFIIGNTCSMTMLDAYYLGTPVVEYSSADPELFELFGRHSLGGACDFLIRRDPDRLKDVLGDLVRGDGRIQHDPGFISENFPDTPADFYDFWREMLTAGGRHD